MKQNPKVSVIVLTKNSEEFIDRVVANLLEQLYDNMEVIIVDNYSTDSTRKRTEHLVDKFIECGPERTAQANCGVRNASGELIYVTGSDMCRDYDFIKQCVQRIQDGYDAVYMSVKTDKDITHFWGKVKALEREMYIGTYIESARFFKKSVWEALSGFDENVIAFEEDFQHRLDKHGYKTAWVTAKEYHLHEDTNLKDIFKKAFYYGKFQRAYLKKHSNRAIKQLNPLRPNLWLLLKHPILGLGFIIYKIVQYTAGIGGLLCNLKEKL